MCRSCRSPLQKLAKRPTPRLWLGRSCAEVWASCSRRTSPGRTSPAKPTCHLLVARDAGNETWNDPDLNHPSYGILYPIPTFPTEQQKACPFWKSGHPQRSYRACSDRPRTGAGFFRATGESIGFVFTTYRFLRAIAFPSKRLDE